MVKAVIRKLIRLPHHINSVRRIKSCADGDYFVARGDVPYQRQFTTPKNTKLILEGKMKAEDDPQWQQFGFATKQEAVYWMQRGCGIACIKMLVDFTGKILSFADLTGQGVQLGGYDTRNDKGWYYKPLLELGKKHGLQGVTTSHCTNDELANGIIQHKFYIASVNPQIIRGDKIITSTQKSGHLILVIGVRVTRGAVAGFYIHNPSGKSEPMRQKAFIPVSVFGQSYGNRGIWINSPV